MKSISFWGRDHKIAARVIIVLCYCILNISGLFLGDILHSIAGSFNPALLLIPLLITIAGFLFYPDKRNKDAYKNFYWQQKANDLLLISATFLFLVFAGNAVNRNYEWGTPVSAAQIIPPAGNKNYIGNQKRANRLKADENTVVHPLKTWRKTFKSLRKKNKALLIIAVILGAGLLSYVVAGLSCGIMCSGSEALGTIVLIVGLTGIVYAAVGLIQRITHGKRVENREPVKPGNKPEPDPVVQ